MCLDPTESFALSPATEDVHWIIPLGETVARSIFCTTFTLDRTLRELHDTKIIGNHGELYHRIQFHGFPYVHVVYKPTSDTCLPNKLQTSHVHESKNLLKRKQSWPIDHDYRRLFLDELQNQKNHKNAGITFCSFCRTWLIISCLGWQRCSAVDTNDPRCSSIPKNALEELRQ